MNDYTRSNIRTQTPYWVTFGLVWLATRLGLELSPTEMAGLTTFAGGFYYAVIRLLEERWPAAGVFLGHVANLRYEGTPEPEVTPSYVPPAVGEGWIETAPTLPEEEGH